MVKKSRKKLSKKGRELASKYIAEEFATRKYKPKQSIAIGISRARERVKLLKEISKRHRLVYR